MSDAIRTDLCVIGGGSGGLSLAAGAVQMGAKVVLIEGHKMGGDCLNYGCVPSKALLAAAGHAHAMTSGAPFGVTPVAPEIDFAATRDHVDRVIAGIAPHDSVARFESLGVQVIEGWARFTGRRTLEAGGREIRARRFVIATGSRPRIPPIAGLDGVAYHTNETIFGLRERPRHLLILGGGPVGMEMAQAHRRLGCAVTVIEGARALGKDDPELTAIALEAIRAEGVTIAEAAMAAEVARSGDEIVVTARDGRRFVGSHLLLALGRKANVERLDLDAAGVRTGAAGIEVDAGLRTSNRRIYAIGDVAGGMQFTHLANYHAGIVIRSALFAMPSRASTAHIPRASYTDPEIAQVGLTEAEARARHGRRLEVLRFGFDENDRARAERRTAGLVKAMVVRGRPVGASIVGKGAGEQIALWALALSAGLKISQMAGAVFPYPTLAEVSKRAAGQYYVPRLFESRLVSSVVGLIQRLP